MDRASGDGHVDAASNGGSSWHAAISHTGPRDRCAISLRRPSGRPAGRHGVGLGLLIAAAVFAVGCSAGGAAATSPTTASADAPAAPSASIPTMVGQTIITGLPGTSPSAAFLARVRRGQIGGVVLYSWNIGRSGPGSLIATLQAAAARGNHPPLLIAIDQEGGVVKRLPGAPTLAPAQMTTSTIARAQGLATARNLARYAINVDLAPVTDVGHGGFITPRTFGPTASEVAVRAIAFAKGLMAGHVQPTMKHFPGLGYATANTDESRVTITASRAKIMADLAPVRTGIAAGVPLVMVATATYPTLGVRVPAATSPTIVDGLLRTTLHFHGVVITDALATPAVTAFEPVATAAVRAIRAGVDMVTMVGTEAGGSVTYSEDAYRAEITAASHGTISLAVLRAAYARILALKHELLTRAS